MNCDGEQAVGSPRSIFQSDAETIAVKSSHSLDFSVVSCDCLYQV
jgi:hypothetical protein